MIEYSSRQLRAFLLVAEHHSFTRAANALFVTPSGLSVMIRELEGQLGFRLFDRTTRQVRLTPHGQQLLTVARRSVDDLEAAASRLARLAVESGHSLSVGTGLLIAANILPQAIKQFRSQRPEIRIRLLDADPATVLQQVEAGELDIGLGSFKSTPSIRRTPFFRFSLMLIGAPGVGMVRPSMPWSALKGERLIAQVPTNSVQQLINRHLAQAGVSSQPAMVLNRLDTIIALVEAGEGIAIVPSYALPACRHRKVVVIRLTSPTVTLDFQQIRHRGRQLPAAADDFTAFLQNYIAGWAGRAGVL
jgi:DNA-binding transcriptional LysR family regulator